MKTIFYVLSIVIIAAAAFFSFTLKNKLAGQMEEYGAAEDSNAQVTAQIRSTENTLAETKDSLGQAKQKREELSAKQGVEESDKRTSMAAIQQYDTDIQGYDAELAEVEELIKKIEEAAGGAGLTIDEIPGEMENLRNAKLDLQKQLEKLTETESKLTRDVASNRTKIENLNDRMADIRQKISNGARVGTVTAVDPTWGFVIVNQGAGNSDVTEESELLVSRGGRYLGRLKVTSLEPNQSICDMEEKTFRQGVRVQPGDSVIIANPTVN